MLRRDTRAYGALFEPALPLPVANNDPTNAAIAGGPDVTLDVVSNDTFTGLKSALTIALSTGSLTDSAAAAVDASNNITFTPSSGASTQSFTYTIEDSVGTSSSATVTVQVTAASVSDGVNELVNSKWIDGSGGIPDGWSDASGTGGSVAQVTSDDVSHDALQFITDGTAGATARVGQDFIRTDGETYWLSVYCHAVSAAPVDGDNIVINWFPFSAFALADGSTRPLASDLVAGERVAVKVTAVGSGAVGLRFGPSKPSTNVTLKRPMIDNDADLRVYVATDPPVAPSFNVDAIPYAGEYEGHPANGYRSNNSTPLGETRQAKRFDVTRSGTIHAFQFMMTSNQSDGETTKSSVNGSSGLQPWGGLKPDRTPHAYPAEWDMRIEAYRGTVSGSTVTLIGSPVFSRDWTYVSQDGSNAYNRCIIEFNNADHGLSIPVTEGETIMFVATNTEADPRNNWSTYINGSAVYSEVGWVGIGSGQANGPYFRDSMTAYEVNGTTCTPRSRGPLNQVAIRYSDGVEDGRLEVDSSFNALNTSVGGSYRVRQTTTRTYYRRASGMIVAAWKRATTSTPLRVTISGSDITTTNLDMASASFPSTGETLIATEANFSSPIILNPSTVYTIELSATSAPTGTYSLGAIRNTFVIGDPINPSSNPPMKAPNTPSSFTLIDRHAWGAGEAEETINGGADWPVVGYNSGNAVLPIALILNGDVAETDIWS